MYIHQATKKQLKKINDVSKKCNADTRKNYNWDTSDRLICDVPYCKNKRWQGCRYNESLESNKRRFGGKGLGIDGPATSERVAGR